MQISKVSAVYFSPTGTTEKAVTGLASGTGIPFQRFDLTTVAARRSLDHTFSADELAIVGLPVYGGRLPAELQDFFQRLKGSGTPAVAVVVYGNREYDDALLELTLQLEKSGFNAIAGCSFVGEHTFSRKIATGRPDDKDIEMARSFGERIAGAVTANSTGRLAVKGNYPFVAKGFDPVHPSPMTAAAIISTSDNCTHCGLCAENCPWYAIDPVDFKQIDSFRCLRCFRCIKICPAGAKAVREEQFQSLLPQFEARLNARRKEPELFLAQ